MLDVGAAGKGQLVDLVTELLVDAGHPACTVDAGGDIRVAGPSVRIALEHPFDPEAAVAVVTLRRRGRSPDPRPTAAPGPPPTAAACTTCSTAAPAAPVDTVAATWAVAGSAMLADALATALFLVPPERARGRLRLRLVPDGDRRPRATGRPGLACRGLPVIVLDRIRGLLGRIPMARLVLLCLAAIAVVAVLASIPGWLGYPTAGLVSSLVVALVAARLAAALMGAIARAPVHGTSSLITGLILFLLLYPSTKPVDLLLLAAAAIVAAASKYLVTVGGRHVLNPAAAGAFVVGLTGLSGGVWWVANPVLLPLVAVTGLVVALRVGAVLPGSRARGRRGAARVGGLDRAGRGAAVRAHGRADEHAAGLPRRLHVHGAGRPCRPAPASGCSWPASSPCCSRCRTCCRSGSRRSARARSSRC